MPDKNVIVLMSGGVDSSVAAVILKEQGYHVVGVTMKIWNDASVPAQGLATGRNACFGPGEPEDIKDAQQVCEHLGIPFHVIDLSMDYKRLVLDYFKKEYLLGRTPNPCSRCNPMVKMGLLIQRARQSGIAFDYFATGHYARIAFDPESGRYAVERSKDRARDQSYFLFRLGQDQLSQVLFPLGEYTKDQVRKVAGEHGMEVCDKKDSQDFFAGDYSKLFGVKDRPGPILDKSGRILGQHKGIWNFTVGQRKGLDIQSPGPFYVLGIDRDKNAVKVGNKQDLLEKELIAEDVNWMAIKGLDRPVRVLAQIRNGHKPASAVISPMESNRVSVVFDEPQMAITPGQAVVFYTGPRVAGGGTITR